MPPLLVDLNGGGAAPHSPSVAVTGSRRPSPCDRSGHKGKDSHRAGMDEDENGAGEDVDGGNARFSNFLFVFHYWLANC